MTAIIADAYLLRTTQSKKHGKASRQGISRAKL